MLLLHVSNAAICKECGCQDAVEYLEEGCIECSDGHFQNDDNTRYDRHCVTPCGLSCTNYRRSVVREKVPKGCDPNVFRMECGKFPL